MLFSLEGNPTFIVIMCTLHRSHSTMSAPLLGLREGPEKIRAGKKVCYRTSLPPLDPFRSLFIWVFVYFLLNKVHNNDVICSIYFGYHLLSTITLTPVSMKRP